MSLWPDVLRFMIYFPLSLYKIVGQGLGQKPWEPTGTLTRGTLPAMTAGDVWERIWFGSMPGLLHAAADARDVFYQDWIRSSLEPELRDAGLKNPAAFTDFLRVMARHTTEVFDSQTMLAEIGLDSDELGDRLNLAGALGILYLLPSFFGTVGKTLEHRPR